MDGYISRETAIAEMTADNLLVHFDSKEDMIEHRFVRAIKRVLAGIPAADVTEIVRCRECRFRGLLGADVPVCTGAMAYSYTPDNWFCADGKPKDGGQDDV